MAQDQISSLPPPNKSFIEPMLKVLGRKTGFKEGVLPRTNLRDG